VLYQLSYGGGTGKSSDPAARTYARRCGRLRQGPRYPGPMGILAWIVLGLVAGWVARFIVPGRAGMGCLTTTAVGILGALIGGAIASAADVGELGTFYDADTWGIAILGAVLLLLVLQALSGRGGARGRRRR
jgi:uncharacterized membrane protein YeaQ/YmgE (transglycosylase-associated protein family)